MIQETLDVLKSELTYQDETHCGGKSDGNISVSHYILLTRVYLARAEEAYTKSNGECFHNIRKACACLFRCMMIHPVPKREL